MSIPKNKREVKFLWLNTKNIKNLKTTIDHLEVNEICNIKKRLSFIQELIKLNHEMIMIIDPHETAPGIILNEFEKDAIICFFDHKCPVNNVLIVVLSIFKLTY